MHGYLAPWIRALVVAHVASAFAFVLLHGPSIAAMMRLRTERDVGAVRALLDMSRAWSGWSWAAWASLATSGAALAASEHTWARPWVWGSIVVLVLVTGSMSPLAARAFNHAREAAGLPWFDGKGVREPKPVDPRALEAALATIRARAAAVLAIGAIGLAALVFLMVAKPG
ncbi:MAG TPA: hypothetical protein VM370_00265 [Candidatus Thermoplasmatota archaeon]|nr:hypothetical protein [Candidatus Thermoplasmatota archaeon]